MDIASVIIFFWLRPCAYMQDRGFNSFASNIIKLLVNEAKWSSFLARTRSLILFISTGTFEKLGVHACP